MQKITATLWFDSQAEDAANHYTSLFENSEILSISRYGEGAPLPEGTVMTVNFTIEGQQFIALNGGPAHNFTEAVSFMISCEDQAEVDRFWDNLTKDGEEGQCGWLKDKFGLSWQVVPSALYALLGDPDPDRAQRAMAAMLQMRRLDIDVMRQAAEQS